MMGDGVGRRRPRRDGDARCTSASFVNMGWGREAGVGAAETVGKVDVKGRLRGLGRDFFGSLALVKETE